MYVDLVEKSFREKFTCFIYFLVLFVSSPEFKLDQKKGKNGKTSEMRVDDQSEDHDKL